jgi:hypothetical protein
MPRMEDDLPALPPAPPGRYRHYKGGEYRLLGVVRHSETLEPLVLYRPLYTAADGGEPTHAPGHPPASLEPGDEAAHGLLEHRAHAIQGGLPLDCRHRERAGLGAARGSGYLDRPERPHGRVPPCSALNPSARWRPQS